MSAGKRWRVRLAAAAEHDFQQILRWTAERFGEQQAHAYAETLSAALQELSAGPTLIGVRPRGDIGRGVFTLHVARARRKGRHFLMFRVSHDQEGEVIEVLRLLHDFMDLPRHLPATD